MVSKLYQAVETAITFKASGGDVVFTPKNIANGAGRISARADLGAWSKNRLYRWYGETQCQATPTVGRSVDIYFAGWDEDTPASPIGDVGSSDAAFSTENDLINLNFLGQIFVDAAAADVKFVRSGLILIPYQYASVVWWDATGASLTNDDAEHIFRLTPFTPEQQ